MSRSQNPVAAEGARLAYSVDRSLSPPAMELEADGVMQTSIVVVSFALPGTRKKFHEKTFEHEV